MKLTHPSLRAKRSNLKNRLLRRQGLLAMTFVSCYLLLVTPAFATEASPSADLQSKINQLKQEIASRATQIKSQVNAKLQNRAWPGQVQSKTDDKITLAGENEGTSLSGKNRTVLINKYTDSPDLLNKDDFIVALGDIDDKGNLLARKIVKQKTTSPLTTQYLWGRSLETSSSGFIFQTKDQKQHSISITSQTVFNHPTTQITPNSFLIAVADQIKGQLQARYIYLVRQGMSSPKPASSSATSSAKKK